jgi:hypothetical protein
MLRTEAVHRALAAASAGVRYVLVVIGVSAVLLAAINVAAYYWLKRIPGTGNGNIFNYVLQPQSEAGIPVLKRIFNASTAREAVATFSDAPGFEMHPTLHYMTSRIDNRHYRTGVEGVRYDAGWDDAAVKGFLSTAGAAIYLMGGSTMFGHGVSGDQTISWYLNQDLAKRGRSKALNLGSEAYDQQREIEKLVYLLRSGYRPRHVVFLDGWNDIAAIGRSNMRRQDKVIFHGFSQNRGEVAFTPGTREGAVNYARMFLESLPVTRYLKANKRRDYGIGSVVRERDPFVQGFDFFEADWMFSNWGEYAIANADQLESELLLNLRDNTEFVERLARRFGFKVTVLLQPLGFFDPKNPFVTKEIHTEPGYKFVERMWLATRSEIARGRIRMIDASAALDSVKADKYIDIAHYSPAANAELAKFIAKRVEE